MSNHLVRPTVRRRHPYIQLFLLGALLYLIAVLPFVVYHDGIFFYYGDYNVQQVPFYVLGNRIVKSGNLYWTTSIDLGTSWLGSFAMYLSGSPFFYLSCLFPESVVPYLMPVLMALKFGTALVTAYAYAQTIIPRQSGDNTALWNRGALVAALLYTFSGWSQTNIVFQHFHEAHAFYPLYLLIFDRFVAAMRARRDVVHKGLAFALMTAFTAVLNYYFFYGEVLFLVLYYLMRYCSRNILREVAQILGYGVLGVALAAGFLIQVYDMLSGNTRLTDTISGLNCVIYEGRTTPLAILKSMFSLPDLVGRGTLFTNETITNSAPGLYLPLFALSGVIAYWFARRLREDWMKRLLLACLVIAFVPVLNAAFNMFNAEYYSRWYFMPILFMAIATGQVLNANEHRRLCYGVWISIAAFAALHACAFLPVFSEMEYQEFYTIQTLLSAALMIALFVYVCVLPAIQKDGYVLLSRSLVVLVMAACLATTIGTLYAGNQIIARTGGTKWRLQLLQSRPEMPETTSGNAALQSQSQDGSAAPWYRIETDSSSTNYELVWGYPTIHSFQSTVPGGLFDFYHGIGYNRTVNTKLSYYRVGTRALCSVRYFLENAIVTTDNMYSASDGMAGYEYVGTSENYDIYEQQHFIPMGFTFDSYITEERYTLTQETSETAADRLLVRDLILSDEDAARYGHLFANGEDTELHAAPADDTEFLADCDQRAASACSYFAYTRNGFEATSDNEAEALVFFSIPYDAGFTAYVDGVETEIVCVDYGLMAVDVPAGEHDITFTYRPQNVTAGYVISAAAAVIIILVYCTNRKRIKRQYK